MPDNYDDSYDKRSGTDSPNNTYFLPSEAPPDDRQHYQRLWFYNEDLKRSRKQYNNDEIWRRDRLAVLDAIASSLELPDTLHDHARSLLEGINLNDELEGRNIPIETYCFAVCAYSYNRQTDDTQRYIPAKDDSKNPQRFVNIKNGIGLNDGTIGQAMLEVQKQV